ncbi:hypothetical protein NJ76_17495 [Rhodococcus sp. IITR03]|nr:hypothetical protein NJ76_17495 [Rhodococcus sp. IITR03]
MTISRSAVGVGGGELSCPVGFGVEEGFSAGCEGVAELGEGVDELLDAFSGRLRCACGFATVASSELLSGVEVAEAWGLLSCDVISLASLNSRSISSQILTISSVTCGSSRVKSDMNAVRPF